MKKLNALLSRRALLLLGGLPFVSAAAGADTKPPKPPAPGPGPAAAGGKEDLVKIDKVTPEVQKTPNFKPEGPKEKRWKPKDWLEIEVDCEFKLSKKGTPDKKQTTYPEATFKYYVFLEGQSQDKNRVLTGEVVHTNIPIGEKVHSSMYVTPSTILSLTGKQEGNANAVKYWGVEVRVGESVEIKSSTGKPWWDAPSAPAKENALKNKTETPFAILWADYHLDVRGR